MKETQEKLPLSERDGERKPPGTAHLGIFMTHFRNWTKAEVISTETSYSPVLAVG